MTFKDSEYLIKLQDYYTKFRGFPSYAGLCGVLGLAAKSSVNKVLVRLAKQDFLMRTPDGVWVPTQRFFERNLSDIAVAAGLPTSVPDGTMNPFLIDQFLVKKPSKTTLVPVRGDSMVDAGIHDGDVVVVEIQSTANTGDIVVAVVDGEFTVKTLANKHGKPILLPANKVYPVIQSKERLEIFGIVIGLIRKYGR